MGLDGRSARRILASALSPLLLALALTTAAAQPAAPVLVAEIKGAIGVASTGFIQRAMEKARAQDATLLVLQLDTPGGLVSSTRDIISAMLASPVPIAVYVAPSGARAASAGTYIAIASHIAAMAPGTHLGAATPVALGGAPGMPGEDKRSEKDKAGDGSAMDRKVINDAVAYIRSLAQLRGRNADWAERAVRGGETLTAEEALRDKVVDLVAPSLAALLTSIDGRKVTTASGERTLATKSATITTLAPDWRDRILAVITDPSIAYLLLIIGIYGIIFEFWSPGFVAPGVIGAISLLLGLAALSVLPVNYAGLALILLGIALMVAEHFTPGIGVMGIGGLVAFVAGSLFLFEPTEGGYEVSVPLPVIAATALTVGALLLWVLASALRSRKAAVVSGVADMIGAPAQVIDWADARGRVRLRGELWNARAGTAFSPGDAVRVAAVEGLTLVVEKEPARR
jgi:membrane-bound serine protease (ClpP class)